MDEVDEVTAYRLGNSIFERLHRLTDRHAALYGPDRLESLPRPY
ncbi:MAG: hypothetical protein ACREDZ_03150 [Kiloniellales bacterium]